MLNIWYMHVSALNCIAPTSKLQSDFICLRTRICIALIIASDKALRLASFDPRCSKLSTFNGASWQDPAVGLRWSPRSPFDLRYAYAGPLKQVTASNTSFWWYPDIPVVPQRLLKLWQSTIERIWGVNVNVEGLTLRFLVISNPLLFCLSTYPCIICLNPPAEGFHLDSFLAGEPSSSTGASPMPTRSSLPPASASRNVPARAEASLSLALQKFAVDTSSLYVFIPHFRVRTAYVHKVALRMLCHPVFELLTHRTRIHQMRMPSPRKCPKAKTKKDKRQKCLRQRRKRVRRRRQRNPRQRKNPSPSARQTQRKTWMKKPLWEMIMIPSRTMMTMKTMLTQVVTMARMTQRVEAWRSQQAQPSPLPRSQQPVAVGADVPRFPFSRNIHYSY